MQMMREIEGVRNLASNVARLMEAGSDPALKKTKGVKVVFQNDYTKKKKTLRSTFIVFFSFFSFFSLSFDFLYGQFSSMNRGQTVICQIPFLLILSLSILSPSLRSIVIVLSLSFHERLIF